MATYAATDQQVIDNPTRYKGTDRITQECGKCSGSGSVYWGVDVTGAIREANGKTRLVPRVCFQCNGTGKYVVLVKTIRARAAKEQRLRAELELQNKRAEQARLARESWNATHPQLVERLTQIAASSRYELRSVRADAQRLLDECTIPAQDDLDRIFEVVDQFAAAEAERAEAPEGRQTVTVTIRGFKDTYTQWGVTVKMLVEHASGWKGYGSVPARMDAEKGDEVTFTATFKRSADDPKFALFKMPRVAS